jgi:two-component system CheB/CheR fusion protein
MGKAREPEEVLRRGKPERRGKAHSFPIAGICASAGGLEAFAELLHNLPADTGIAFVLVQHLDPTHESILSEILSKSTPVAVRQVANNTRLEPNQVYVIPPNAKMSIVRGVIKLVTGPRKAGEQHSIDHFLQSLAEERGPQAIGVILSGSGSDGTLGLQAIKSAGGITFVQDDTAKYESMPRNAIASGCVDFVLPPAKIAQELGRIARHPHLVPLAIDFSEELSKEGSDYKKVLQLLRMRSGVDFTLYKPPTIHRRISRRMALNQVPRLSAYLRYLREHPVEIDALYQDVLINVTAFFRNPEAFRVLKDRVFPSLLRTRSADHPVRVWVLGCSTGQEVYSIAMAFMEYAAQSASQVALQVFGTDINETVLDKARAGLYPRGELAGVSQERLRRFFVEEEAGWRICKPIREVCVFAKHDLLVDPPFSRMDLLSCRNLMIYLQPALQKRLLPIFHYALRPSGFLLLGNSETIGEFTSLFAPEDKTHKLYAKRPGASRPEFKMGVNPGLEQKPSARQKRPALTAELTGEMEAQKEADRIILAKYAPAGVLVNEGLEVLQFRGHTGLYLEPAQGRASHNLAKMLREGLFLPVRSAIQQARKTGETVRSEDIDFAYDSQSRHATIEVVPLKSLKERWFLVLFEPPVARRPGAEKGEPVQRRPALPPNVVAAQREVTRLRNELAATRDYLQQVMEQYGAANEELQSSNEEAQSSNEELQSINEELETTKEELQSTNEELTTVNEEMGNRNLELHRMNSDLHNVLGAVQMCIVVLDAGLCIRRFTPLAERILNLGPTDVGRSIAGVRPNVDVPDLERIIVEVVKEVRPLDREVQDKSGRWFSLRILPYKTVENRIEGAVLVLVDIDALKRSEQRLQGTLHDAEAIIETVREPLVVLDAELKVRRANRAFYQVFRLSPTELEGQKLNELGGGQWNITELTRRLREVLPDQTAFNDFQVEREFERIGRRTMLLNGRPMLGEPGRILLAIEDITERKQLEVLRESEQRFRTLAEALPQLVWTSVPDGICDYFNSKWADYTGVPVGQLLGLKWRETIHAEDRERTYDFWCAALKGDVPYDLEYRIRRKDGVFHWFKVRATPLRDTAGQIVKWFGTCTDIEDQKEAQRLIQQSEARLKALSEELEQRVQNRTAQLRGMVEELEAFSYTVSHDLRTPLRAIQGFATLALQESAKPQPLSVKEYLEKIVVSARRADELVRDVLNYSRISRTVLKPVPVDLEKLLREQVIEANEQLQAPNAEIVIASPLLPVLGNEAILRQCLNNLLSNATKFVLPGTVPRVKIWTEGRDGRVRIWLEDNGIGIEPGNLSRIFGIFERVHSAREYEGTGIGLSIVRKGVERLGGSVGVESEPGTGSKFWLELSAVKPEQQPQAPVAG